MSTSLNDPAPIWWSNAIFFVGVHFAALVGIYYHPLWMTPFPTLLLTLVLWQVANFSITIGYHRLYSHKAFRTGLFIKTIVALLGASACQGSIKWWSLRHRLHHRFTDDPVHDPYAATHGLLWSHMGWIFFKSKYERMGLIDSADLENDRVARMQHKYYVPLVLFTAFVAPMSIGRLWHDVAGAFVWAGLVKCLLVWHCTFLINSVAHWDGIQPYSDENTSRTNLILAILTCGEGNHNFHVGEEYRSEIYPNRVLSKHTFPHDFRSGPTFFEWDPSKWIILTLHHFGLATGLRRARQEDLDEARFHMLSKASVIVPNASEQKFQVEQPLWTLDEAQTYTGSKAGRCLLVLNGYILDVTTYLGEHPGGAIVLRKYALPIKKDKRTNKNFGNSEEELWKQTTWAFSGGLNIHSRTAKKRLQDFTIAKLVES